MIVTILASGSSGNGTLLEIQGSRILIDAGIPMRDFLKLFATSGVPDALLITHSHSDHIKSAGALARKLKIPVYLHSATYEKKQKIFNNCKVQFIDPGVKEPLILFDKFKIEPFNTNHDVEACLGFRITDLTNDRILSYITDTGSFTRVMYEKTKNAHAYIIETDYDEVLLEKTAEYDDILKDRIRSDFGHLSNQQVIEFCKRLDLDKISFVGLIHLSKVTNSPELVTSMFTESFPEYKNTFIVEPLNNPLTV